MLCARGCHLLGLPLLYERTIPNKISEVFSVKCVNKPCIVGTGISPPMPTAKLQIIIHFGLIFVQEKTREQRILTEFLIWKVEKRRKVCGRRKIMQYISFNWLKWFPITIFNLMSEKVFDLHLETDLFSSRFLSVLFFRKPIKTEKTHPLSMRN